MKIYSWNVNGIRAIAKKGFVDWVYRESPDILCIQETKAQKDQLSEDLISIEGYKSYFMQAEKKGYSGVALYTKETPIQIEKLGIEKFDNEGRVIIAHYLDFILINAYFPNSQTAGKRLEYKVEFCDALLECSNLLHAKYKKSVIICGDYNIAHTEIDLANPKENEKNPGYLPEERAWMSKFLDAGYSDVFRELYPDTVKYSWWSYRTRARERNVGWRIDYLCVKGEIRDKVADAEILNEVIGSDHCPVTLKIK